MPFHLKHLLLSTCLFISVVLQGAEIKVNSLNDSGSGSLREAISGAASGDTILIRAEGVIALNSPIPVKRDLTITGQNGPLLHTISASGGPLFEIARNRTVTFSRLTLGPASSSADGGLTSSEGHLSLVNVRLVSGTAAGKGGAVFQKGGSLTIDGALLQDNTAASGGAIAVDGATLSVSSAGFFGNTATGSGGALLLSGSSVAVINSTFAGNSAGGDGGLAAMPAGQARLVNLTLTENTSGSGTIIEVGADADLEIGNSIVSGPDGFGIFGGAGSVVSLGHNLSDGPLASWNTASDIADSTIGMGEASDLGGLSPVYPLKPGSAAIDGGDDSIAAGADQRGLSRFSDGDADGSGKTVDIGAFEVQLYTVSSLQIYGSSTGGADDGGYGNPLDPSDDADSIASADVFAQLTALGRADIGDAVGANNAAGGGAVSFREDLIGGRAKLKGSELEVRRDIAIYGPGANLLAIDGDGRSRVVRVSDGALLYLNGISIENGSADFGSGIFLESGAALETEEVAISGNTAIREGGGVGLDSGRAHLFRSTLSGNAAGLRGGALSAHGGTSLFIDNSTVSGNTSGSAGGGVYADGTLWIDSSTFSGNAAGTGAAIFADAGSAGSVRNTVFKHGTDPAIVAEAGSAFLSDGYNISDGGENLLAGPGDRVLTDPQIEPLALNGGSTLSHAPVPGGPAINSGDSSDPAPYDQPGFPRLRGGAIDVGSVEFQNDPPVIDCPVPVILECDSGGTTDVVLTASVDDADGDGFVVTWKLDGIVFDMDTVSAGASLPAEFTKSLNLSLGDHTVTIVAVDDYGLVSVCTIPVSIVDTTPPEVTLNGPAELSLECGVSYTDAGATATDACDSSVTAVLTQSDLPESGVLQTGTYSVTYSATDASGNTGSETRILHVADTTAPVVSLSGPASVVLECGVDTWNDPGALADDGCDGILPVTTTVSSGGIPVDGVSTAMPGSFSIIYSATDAAGNVGTVTRVVEVRDTIAPEISAPDDFTELTDPGFCSANIAFAATATDNCSAEPVITYAILANESFATDTEITSSFDFPPGVHVVECTATDASGNASTATFQVTVTDDFLNCIENTSWPNALPLELQAAESGGPGNAEVRQFLALTDQARWYRFNVQPGSRVTVILSQLPANYDVVVYRDIAAEYQRQLDLFNSPDPETQELALLGAEFAPESFSPESFSPESFSPESFSPESFSPESFSPESFSPESFSPESFSPESFSPESFSPESFSPESFSPESFSPESFSPESFSPESFSPESFSPESFSAAQVSSMIGYSAFPGVASEGVAINTFTRSGDFYVRIRGANGAYSVDAPFKLSVLVEPEICDGLQGPETFGEPTLAPASGDFESIILWDSSRMEATPEVSVAELAAKLDALAARPDVNGVVVDVALEDRVLAANLQADALPACPYAKNLVAEEIKAIIDGYQALNPGLKYVVLVGNDDAIPFFRTPDESFLAPESNYIPPVIDSTHSQSSLRFRQVLTQDPYGATCELNLVTGPFPYPDLAVGRLVESVEDVAGQIDNYLATTDGILPQPQTALSTGYDFLDDAARAVQFEFEAALGGPVNSLIADSTLSPSEGWTATELAEALLGSRHDIVFLAGHFSTGSALAADYETRLTAAQVQASGADFLNTLVFSAGCHSGYNTVDAHAINGITKQPDWAQAFASMGAIFIAGTGYQYGDTEFVEYGERLYLEFTRQLRTGSEPVSIGEALVQAKRKYLAETPLMRGIHEKTLVQTTLFGLPMVRMDVPGARLADSSIGEALGIVPSGYSADPGLTLGLQRAEVSIEPSLVLKSLDLTNIEDNSTVTAQWFEGRHGFVTNPAEPNRPLEVYLASVDGTLLRGVGFRGGVYQDINDFLPLTGAPTTEIRGVYGNFFSEVWYPVQPYSLNYLGTLCGGTDGQTRLNLYPAQFLAEGGGALGGTMRTYDNMDFRLYYSNNRDVYTASGVPSIPALAAPPTIAKVSSEANADETEVHFRIHILGNPAAGIQEAWITYTGIPGSLLHGEWSALDLVQDAQDSTLWKAVLPLNGALSDEVRFMVQAVSGTGLVALNTNFGRYYEVGVDELAPRIPTEMTLIDPPAGGAYGESLPVAARLTSEGQPLAGVRVGFRVGNAKTGGFTDANGVAEVLVPLTTRPGDQLLQAYFQGDRDYAPSAVSSQVTVVKQTTLLTFEPVPPEPFGSDIVVALSDGTGKPLKERTVFFLVDYGTFQIGNAVITDFSGRADLSEIDLPGGDATITAYFNGTIPIPGADPVTIGDDLYLPAVNSIDVTLADPLAEDSLGFDARQVDVHYKSTGGKGKDATAPVYENASIGGSVAFNVPLQPYQLLATPDAPAIEATIEARLSGELIASDSVILDTRGNNGNHWTTARRPGEEVAYVGIHWSNSPRFDTALSGSPGPRIYTNFIGNNFSELHYVPTPGSYETVLPDGSTVVVKNGAIDVGSSTALLAGDHTVDETGELTLALSYGVEPGMVFTTRSVPKGDLIAEVTVVEGVNYLLEGGRMIVRLVAVDGTPRPASDADFNLFEVTIVIGSGEGETEVRSSARIGEGLNAVPWSSEDPNHKQYRP